MVNQSLIGASAYGYRGFAMQTTVSDQGLTHLLYYSNRGWDGGKTFCQIKNEKITFGQQWCYDFEEEINQMCGQLKTHVVYDFPEHFQQMIRNKALSELV